MVPNQQEWNVWIDHGQAGYDAATGGRQEDWRHPGARLGHTDPMSSPCACSKDLSNQVFGVKLGTGGARVSAVRPASVSRDSRFTLSTSSKQAWPTPGSTTRRAPAEPFPKSPVLRLRAGCQARMPLGHVHAGRVFAPATRDLQLSPRPPRAAVAIDRTQCGVHAVAVPRVALALHGDRRPRVVVLGPTTGPQCRREAMRDTMSFCGCTVMDVRRFVDFMSCPKSSASATAMPGAAKATAVISTLGPGSTSSSRSTSAATSLAMPPPKLCPVM